MTVEHRRLVVAAVALIAVGFAARAWFVDVLTKTTGTWIGGVESPQRRSVAGSSGEGRGI
jgi:hypothetical protein